MSAVEALLAEARRMEREARRDLRKAGVTAMSDYLYGCTTTLRSEARRLRERAAWIQFESSLNAAKPWELRLMNYRPKVAA